MAKIKVRFKGDNPNSGYGFYQAGDVGTVVGYTQGLAVVVKEDGTFVKAELSHIVEMEEDVPPEIQQVINDHFDEMLDNEPIGVPIEKVKLAAEQDTPEQKPAEEIEPTPIFKIGDIIKRKGKDYTFRVDRIQSGYYHCDLNHGAFFPIEEQGKWKLVEQKSAWSEEDEEMFDAVITDIQFTQKAHNHEVNQIVYEREIDWLKSLKDRYTWKPSDEQMKCLDNVKGADDHTGYVLNTLFNDLKKLKG